MKQLIRFLLPLTLLLAPGLAMASAPSLQVNPLKYESTMLGNDVRNGYVDVSNPTDTNLNIEANVRGFRQNDLAGDLTFFDGASIDQGIKLGLTSFQLGPRQAVRITFTVDPTKLPKGGVYAVIFFQTIPPQQSSSSSFVTESANVGTLLLLQNGPANAHIGQVTRFDVPFFQLGGGISGTAQYQNTNHSTAPVAFSPSLTAKIFPWGHANKITGPYVLPGSIREFTVNRPGSYLGFVPISLIDQDSGVATTRWVIACTGTYAFGLLFIISFLIVWTTSRLLRKLPLIPMRRMSNEKNEESDQAEAPSYEEPEAEAQTPEHEVEPALDLPAEEVTIPDETQAEDETIASDDQKHLPEANEDPEPSDS